MRRFILWIDNMSKKTIRRIMLAIIIFGMVTAGLALFADAVPFLQKVFLYGGGGIMVSGVVFGLLFLRCPHCGSLLNLRGLSPDYCPHCGERLN
jgi:hypothetical protein